MLVDPHDSLNAGKVRHNRHNNDDQIKDHQAGGSDMIRYTGWGRTLRPFSGMSGSLR